LEDGGQGSALRPRRLTPFTSQGHGGTANGHIVAVAHLSQERENRIADGRDVTAFPGDLGRFERVVPAGFPEAGQQRGDDRRASGNLGELDGGWPRHVRELNASGVNGTIEDVS
jgi:hypothetical protein